MSETPVKWTAAGLTPEGNALQAALLGTGDGLTFTRAAAADAEGVERLDLTLQAPCTVDGPKCRVPVLLTNAGLDTGFTMTELRFYVRRVTDGAPTGEEVLYATVTDETGDPIPTAAQSPGFTIDWAFVFQYGNASEVTVTLDPVGLVSIGMVGQPNGVAGLGDNGAVPIEQGGTGATTVQGVVDAFGIFLAISAAAVYDPEKSYAVGDYCTHGGKLHKCGTAIPDGEAWNAAHWTETTVAKELAVVLVSLSSKLDKYTKMQNAPQSWSEIWALEPGVYSWVQVAPFIEWQPKDTPSGMLRAELTVHSSGATGGSKSFILSYIDGGTYLKRYFGEQSGDGKGRIAPISTATPPQVRNFTLQSVFSAVGNCTFFATQENVVFLAGGISGTIPAIQEIQIGTLPADACPSAEHIRPAVTNSGGAYLRIRTDGTVWLYSYEAAVYCYFDISFVAGGGA